MAKTKIEVLKDYVANIEALKDVAKDLQREVIQEANKEYTEITKDQRLSADGIALELQEARKQYAEYFLTKMQEINKQYDLYIKNAKNLAEQVLAQPVAFDGTDSQRAVFELALRDLQTRVMLAYDASKGADMIERFVAENNSPYKAQEILAQFNTLIAPFANADGKVKQQLSRAFAMAQSQSMDENKEFASQVMQISDTPKLVLTMVGAPSFETLIGVIGESAKYANDPQTGLEKLSK